MWVYKGLNGEQRAGSFETSENGVLHLFQTTVQGLEKTDSRKEIIKKMPLTQARETFCQDETGQKEWRD